MTNKIAKLNDQLRQTRCGGKFILTRGVADMGDTTANELIMLVAAYDDFTPDNDPHGEHDFGSIKHRGNKCLWKIDYYDLDYQYHSTDPSNPDITNRVLTLMLASEY